MMKAQVYSTFPGSHPRSYPTVSDVLRNSDGNGTSATTSGVVLHAAHVNRCVSCLTCAWYFDRLIHASSQSCVKCTTCQNIIIHKAVYHKNAC